MANKTITWPELPFTLISSTSYLKYTSTPPAGQDILVQQQQRQNEDAIHVARLMALTHNTLFRALNAAYAQASAVSPSNPKDVAGLMDFTRFAILFLENHHRCEELVFFPMLEAQGCAPGLMEGNVAQHRAFEGALGELKAYVDGVLTQGKRFDVTEFRGRMHALQPALERHMREEIASILEVGRRMSDEAMRACYRALHDEAEGTTDAFEIGPLVMGCQDSTLLMDGYRIQFPELPFKLAPYAVEHIVSRRHANAWRFCPSTFHGEPRQTEFFQFGGGFIQTRRDVGAKKGAAVSWVFFLLFLLMAVFLGSRRLGLDLPWELPEWKTEMGRYWAAADLGNLTTGTFDVFFS